MNYNKLNGLSLKQAEMLLHGIILAADHSSDDYKYLSGQLKSIIKYHEEENAKLCYCGYSMGEHKNFTEQCVPF